MAGKRVIISGGGTGGHIFPAIAIANAIKEKAADTEFLFVGAQGKMEMEKVPKAGYDIKGLWISGFDRSKWYRIPMFGIKLIWSLIKARRIIKSFKPDVVIGVGGYASGPTLEMATRNGIPTMIQEQNSWPGITNKLLAKKVDKICVAYEGMNRFFPEGKINQTGNPVRTEVANFAGSQAEARAHFGLQEDTKTLFVLGGSLGARTLNQSMDQAFDLLNEGKVQVLWQCGKIYEEQFSKTKTAQLDQVKMTAFVDRMDLAYAAADVIISRAGALSISELCLIGKPVILVPSPNVAEDHQTKNAEALVEKEAAILIKDAAAVKDLLPSALALLENAELRKKLGENIHHLARPDATDKITNIIFDLIK